MADIEKLQNWKERVANLSDGSPLSTWKGILQSFLDLYKQELEETLTLPALETERQSLQTNLNTLLADMANDTSKVLK